MQPSHLELEALVGDWLTVPDLVERLGMDVPQVRRMIRDRELVGIRVGQRPVLKVPAKFLDDQGVIPSLRGTFTVLADAGLDEVETITWLFTPDPTLPVDGSPMDAILAGFKTEIRRRASELAL